jgi:hypothetical protein
MPSSVVAAFHYYPAKDILRIVYTSGEIYDYKDVPADVYERMRHARSKGVFLNKEIKGKFTFEKRT